ncbi:PRKC apoptosis WT1 regulator protein [Amia ocellicauda]|uniref:PRKC apoptosis WT1 regulator protein n=1 Tax=Amia ocellicauda TaxID=2972642 RepID=UPI00346483DF
MATGGFRSSTTTDFLEEWKAKREKMRAKIQGEVAAAGGSGNSSNPAASPSLGPGSESRSFPAANSELHNHGGASFNCAASHPGSRSSTSTSTGPRRPEEDPHLPTAGRAADPPGSSLKKPPVAEKLPAGAPQSDCSGEVCVESEKEGSPSPAAGSGKAKEKGKSSGPSARKGKGQIEKRKLREKRRSTGVVSIPSNESLDELEDDDGTQKDRKREDAITQQNTVQNEALASDPSTAHLIQDTSKSVSSRYKSSVGPASEEEATGNSRYPGRPERSGYGRHGRDANALGSGALERRIEELERELAKERQENTRMLRAHQDKDEVIGKLREEIDLLNRDLDDIEDENEQLKQENKTLLKVVGQLTR